MLTQRSGCKLAPALLYCLHLCPMFFLLSFLIFVCLPPSRPSHVSPLEHKLLESWNPVTLFTIVVLTVLHKASAQSIFVEEMKEAGGRPPFVLISAGNLSFYYHLVGTFVYCGVGEKCSNLSLTQAEGSSQRGQRAPPCGVPVICVLV